MDEDWQADLERWLELYLVGLGNKMRRRMCSTLYRRSDWARRSQENSAHGGPVGCDTL